MEKFDVDCWNRSFEQIYARYPTNEVITDFGRLLSNAISELNKVKSYQKSRSILEILKNRYAAHKALEFDLVLGLQGMTHHYGQASPEDLKYYVEIAREIYGQSGNYAARISLMGALGNMIIELRQSPGLAFDYLNEIRSLYDEHDDPFLELIGLWIAVKNADTLFSHLNRYEELEANFIDKKWDEVPIFEARAIISGALYRRLYNHQINPTDFFLLYGLRYHLPNKKSLEVIESMASGYLILLIYNAFRSGTESVRTLITEIRAAIKEESDFVVLIESIAGVLDVRTSMILIQIVAEQLYS